MKTQIETAIKNLLDKKDTVIKDAITYGMGHPNWDIDEIKHRCQFYVIRDKSETLVFDDKPMVVFDGNLLTEITKTTLKVELNYEVLYDNT